MRTDENLANEMIEKLPIGVYVVNKDDEILYYNQAFLRMFSIEIHELNPYFGDLVRCIYCNDQGKADKSSYRCNNCPILEQHDLAFWEKRTLPSTEVVQEFSINGKNKLMFLNIQSVYLDQDRVMVLVRDLTDIAENLATDNT